ncbi:unnamed protein product [Vitrella brassicaformis CCMP3155]|uniref:Uncharacterized protein n=1 Tax=Vitrella brassicaformis (strain CCMP3155) TaxID=1169540 RepID=A0A0G4EHV3_VITBC|nr:unnamed protein product [Vitrella brassicaformis CCMP3155]|mmetsp:Transcript_14881/g.42744  ORF Transcript_14881/g.42744 Transcript_14881/m.42744 type:complete len:250 (+) Transcript_14881:118-867(+)|eukprot:CEL95570.1 unnamed protein product [Vitrella brassicaformis CCMP3155]
MYRSRSRGFSPSSTGEGELLVRLRIFFVAADRNDGRLLLLAADVVTMLIRPSQREEPGTDQPSPEEIRIRLARHSSQQADDHTKLSPASSSGFASASTRAAESPASPLVTLPEGDEFSPPGSEHLLCECRVQVTLLKWHCTWVRRTVVVSGVEALFCDEFQEQSASGHARRLVRQITRSLVSFPSPKSGKRVRETLKRSQIVGCRMREHNPKLEIVINTRCGAKWRLRCCTPESVSLLYRSLKPTTQSG